MRPVLIEDLLMYRFLSDVRIAPNGKRAAFLVNQVNRDKKSYRLEVPLVQLEGGSSTRLTDKIGKGRTVRLGYRWRGSPFHLPA